MITTRTILGAVSLIALMALTTNGTEIEFCQDAVYGPGEVCPATQPSSGSGTCYNLTVEAGICCKSHNDDQNDPRSDAAWECG